MGKDLTQANSLALMVLEELPKQTATICTGRWERHFNITLKFMYDSEMISCVICLTF